MLKKDWKCMVTKQPKTEVDAGSNLFLDLACGRTTAPPASRPFPESGSQKSCCWKWIFTLLSSLVSSTTEMHCVSFGCVDWRFLRDINEWLIQATETGNMGESSVGRDDVLLDDAVADPRPICEEEELLTEEFATSQFVADWTCIVCGDASELHSRDCSGSIVAV